MLARPWCRIRLALLCTILNKIVPTQILVRLKIVIINSTITTNNSNIINTIMSSINCIRARLHPNTLQSWSTTVRICRNSWHMFARILGVYIQPMLAILPTYMCIITKRLPIFNCSMLLPPLLWVGVPRFLQFRPPQLRHIISNTAPCCHLHHYRPWLGRWLLSVQRGT